MSIYYVYAYLRENQTPYYIGKGKGDRAWNNSGHTMRGIHLPKDRKNNIIILQDNLEEHIALDIEAELIAHYGRQDLGTGILHNKTDGGPSPVLYGEQNGMTRRAHTEKTKQLIRETKLGKSRRNDKRILCECCNKEFSPQAFFKHNPSSEQSLKLRPYKCIHCDKLFTRWKNLSTHIRNLHPGYDAYIVKNPLEPIAV